MKIRAIRALIVVTCLVVFGWLIVFKTLRQSSEQFQSGLSQKSAELNAARQPSGTNGTERRASMVTTLDQDGRRRNAGVSAVVSEPVYSETLLRLLESPGVCLRPDELKKLTRDEVKRIIVEYEKIEDPSKKRGLVWALGFSGSEDAVEVLLKAVSTEYAARRLDVRQVGSAHLAFSALGILGEHSQRALNFLVAGSRVDYWTGREPWLVEAALAENIHWRLAGECISALGKTGSDLGLRAVMTIRESDSATYQAAVANSLVSSIFYTDMRRTYGTDFFHNELLFDGTVMMAAVSIWRSTTAEGREWSEWSDGVRKFPSVEHSPTEMQRAAFEAAVARWQPPPAP